MGREEGGGFRMGNTCIPVADSFLYIESWSFITHDLNFFLLKIKHIFDA